MRPDRADSIARPPPGDYDVHMEFSAEDLFDAVDRLVMSSLSHVGIREAPVDTLRVASEGFHLRIEYAEPEDPHERQYGDRPRRRASADTVLLRDDMTEESQHLLAARAVARRLLPQVLAKLGVNHETENRQANAQLVNMIAPRLLLPTRWFAGDAARAGYDLFRLKEKYTTAGMEMMALRMLDLDDPCLIAIVDDDGTIVNRRSNRFQAPRKLTEAEMTCRELIQESGEPAQAKGSGWIVRGWPTPGVPFRRIVMRSVPEDV